MKFEQPPSLESQNEWAPGTKVMMRGRSAEYVVSENQNEIGKIVVELAEPDPAAEHNQQYACDPEQLEKI